MRPDEDMSVVTVTDETRASVVAQAARTLMQGGVVVLPTDTVYGLAAHPARAEAVARLYAIKGRPAGKPLALLAADTAAAEAYGAILPPHAQRLAANFWPGALTLVVNCAATTEGLRVPAHALTRELLAACGGVLRVTSANISGTPPALSAAESLRDLGTAADLVIDDGPAPGGVPSSVVRITATGWELLRSGAIALERLRQAAVIDENEHQPATSA
jgi:L-threonylcarbamoyladenylate synthase